MANSPTLNPLRSVHTTSFTDILNQLGLSLVISTYQAGKLVVARADGAVTNTHFRMFNKPMGIAATPQRMALGTAAQIWELHNIPDAAAKVDPPGKHDACFIPRDIRITGDIDIHEMAWDQDGVLWFINTRFSCLCTLDKNNDYSFVPQWRPPFISAYDLMDRCHLNGLAMRDGKPRYVTALGATDTAGGWRENKANGGILMDMTTNEILLNGLSMPHSPRWYSDRLWVLESGKGSLAYRDANTGTLVTVATLPGFTRGLDFYGPLAFIGLSQVRESAVFSGIPITKTLTERICGVWVVNWQTGDTVAFLRFEDGVQEIFAVTTLPGIRFPEIVEADPVMMGTSYILPDEALADVQRPTGKEEFAQPHLDAGVKAYNDGQFEAAIASFRRCLEIQPDFLPARYNLGVVLGDLDRYDEAIVELEQVVAAEASHAEAHNSLGYAYSRQNNPASAIAHYENAIAIRPDYAKAHYNLGMTLLQQGQWQRGWQESEWRWKTAQFTPFDCPQPLWDGSPLPGQAILIHSEQGAGDTIQFFRYLPLVAQRCQQVIFVCPENLLSLFAPVLPVNVITQTAGEIQLSAFAAYAPLMSLPVVFNTTEEMIPGEIPYLKANPVKLSLSQVSKSNGDRLRIGITWGGSPTHGNDRHRSAKLQDFLPLLRCEGIDWFSLQKGSTRVAELEQLPSDISLINLDPQLKDFSDTAAAIAQLDGVVTVDTAVAHLAGALGKPVWVLLSAYADWRWLLDRDDSPWYASMQLLRQSRLGDWTDVVERACVAIKI
ncbi:MAG: TIGR03032 family protein [Merismopedia sp. SIO2A8]|nr:TIGR03032 family protein [Merismopedia sp. SIO2A8]